MPTTESEGIDWRRREYILLNAPGLRSGAPFEMKRRHALLR